MTTADRRLWLAANEGYYGPPLGREARVAMVEWLSGIGYDAYIYSPKDDPFQRQAWREPYPDDALGPIVDLVDACRTHGLEAGLTISPGLDWRVDDPTEIDSLTAKVSQLAEAGATCIGILWDDVPGAGADLGAAHATAVSRVVERVGADGRRWLTCPIDYAVDTPTEYLAAFAAELHSAVELLWTGPSVLTSHLSADHVRSLSAALGRRLTFAENFPVNDLGMSGALHLGPYPARDPEAVAAVAGATMNLMSQPLASRIGLELAARAWRNPTEDHHDAWLGVVDRTPGLSPLARACSSWLDRPGPDPELVEWATAAGPDDQRLRRFLEAGCRDGLDADLAAEVEPWLDAWEGEAEVMLRALDVIEDGSPSFVPVARLAATWQRRRAASVAQVFGIRHAIYPATRHDGQRLLAVPGAVIDQPNLTDLLVRRVLDSLTDR